MTMTAEPWPLPRLYKWSKEVRSSRTYLSVGRLEGQVGGQIGLRGEDQTRAGPREGEAGTVSLGRQVHSPLVCRGYLQFTSGLLVVPAIPQEHLQAIKTLTCGRPLGN